MQLHFNDLCLCGQFATPNSFRAAIEPILRFRREHARLSQRFYCCRSLSQRPATPLHTVQEAVVATNDRDFKALVLRWLGTGPFWDDERAENPDDYFLFEGQDVTEQGLGEAARRIILKVEAGSFSLADGATRFQRTPLSVTHGLLEDPLGEILVPGIWDTARLTTVLTEAPETWEALVGEASSQFDLLWFSPDVLQYLRKVPFDYVVADRAIALFSILQSVAKERTPDGALSPRGLQVWQQYSVGDNALFTDESDQNKVDFRNVLQFRDPENGRSVSATWHGKIKHLQFRIHFEWPMRADEARLRIFYIGPKITKR